MFVQSGDALFLEERAKEAKEKGSRVFLPRFLFLRTFQIDRYDATVPMNCFAPILSRQTLLANHCGPYRMSVNAIAAARRASSGIRSLACKKAVPLCTEPDAAQSSFEHYCPFGLFTSSHRQCESQFYKDRDRDLA